MLKNLLLVDFQQKLMIESSAKNKVQSLVNCLKVRPRVKNKIRNRRIIRLLKTIPQRILKEQIKIKCSRQLSISLLLRKKLRSINQ